MSTAIVDVLTGDAFRAYERAQGPYSAEDYRFALTSPEANANSVPCRRNIYAAISAIAAGIDHGGNGADAAARRSAAQEIVRAWPRAWNTERRAAVDPIFDDRYL